MIYPWQMNEGPNMAGEMPMGAITRPAGGMGTAALQAEMSALGSPMGRYGGRAPGMGLGLLAGLGGIPGLGFALGGMAGAGMRNRYDELFAENQRRQIGNMYPGAGAIVPQPGLGAPSPVGLMQAAAETGASQGGGYSSADRSGRNETTSERGGLGGV